MAGLRSNYELKKWQAVQNIAQVPLAKVISGLYTEKDMNTLGQALEAYDDLASSIFNEGLRAVEQAAKSRVEKVQEHRTLVKKPPLSARQLAIIYGQAVDKAQKETMPELITAIKELLELRAMTPQDNPGLHVVGQEPEPAPRPAKKYNLERFTPQAPANDNEAADRKAHKEKVKATEDAKPEAPIEKVMGLFGEDLDDIEDDLDDLEEGQKSLGSDLKEILSLINLGYKADEKERTKLESLIDSIDKGSIEYDSKSEQLKLSYISDSGYYREVEGKTAADLKTKVRDFNKIDRKRLAAEKQAKEKRTKAQELYHTKGWLAKPLNKMDRAQRLKELKVARKERDIKSGATKEGKMDKASRLIDNSKEEYSKITEMLKARYSKSIAGKLASKVGGIGKMLLGLFLLPKMLSSLWAGFTKQFDAEKFMKDTLDKTLTAVWDKVKSLIGIGREDEYDKSKGELSKTGVAIRESDDMSIPAEQRQASKDIQKAKILKELQDPNGPKYTPRDAELIKSKLGVDVPPDRIQGGSSQQAPSSGSGGAGADAASPGAGGSSPGASSSTGAGGGRGSQGMDAVTASSPAPSSAGGGRGSQGVPSGVEPPSTSAQVSSSPSAKGGGGLTADTPMPMKTMAGGQAGPAASAPVTATPPPKAEAPSAGAGRGNQGVTAGSSPINCAAVPGASLNSEAGFVLNCKPHG